jgi:hypothetical protein
MAYLTLQTGGGSDDEIVGGLYVFNTATTGSPGTDPSSPPTNARQHGWVPYSTTLKVAAVKLTAAPGSGKTANFRAHKDSDTSVSAIFSITGASATDVQNDIEAAIDALDPTSDVTIRNTYHYMTAWPSAGGNTPGAGFRAWEYLTVAHPELCYFVCNIGNDIQTATFAGVDAYSTIVGGSIDSGSTTQSARQIPMSIKGRVKVAWAAWRGFDNTNTVTAFLQKGTLGAGVDTAVGFTMVGAGTTTPYQAAVTAFNVAVAEGDFLNWHFKRTAGAATGGAIQVGFGYAAGLP